MAVVKTQQIVVKQAIVENSDPVAYQYTVTKLQNRLEPRIGTVLDESSVQALIAEEGLYVSVQ